MKQISINQTNPSEKLEYRLIIYQVKKKLLEKSRFCLRTKETMYSDQQLIHISLNKETLQSDIKVLQNLWMLFALFSSITVGIPFILWRMAKSQRESREQQNQQPSEKKASSQGSKKAKRS
ncbi:UNKNOWN [Stylonychia lemnae]|uniref:Uncharacterized protein n=1 Tax=Stylonychia lemnae TaxID=5949 RepID=A0A078APA0_STYLE|nr:UNKNOWN [Stylonychia lemnae]|eukprot:CDW83954.1 UNKNOWN [Stylonychia lemnae]